MWEQSGGARGVTRTHGDTGRHGGSGEISKFVMPPLWSYSVKQSTVLPTREKGSLATIRGIVWIPFQLQHSPALHETVDFHGPIDQELVASWGGPCPYLLDLAGQGAGG